MIKLPRIYRINSDGEVSSMARGGDVEELRERRGNSQGQKDIKRSEDGSK